LVVNYSPLKLDAVLGDSQFVDGLSQLGCLSFAPAVLLEQDQAA